METIIKKSLTLTMETSKGGMLEESFANYAEMFDFITERVMGNSAYDHDAEEMIAHVGDQWANRSKNENTWKRKGWKYSE